MQETAANFDGSVPNLLPTVTPGRRVLFNCWATNPHIVDLADFTTVVRQEQRTLPDHRITIPASAGPHAQFQHLYHESRNRERRTGASDLYLAWPILAGIEADTLYALPAFFWPVKLEPQAGQTWVLTLLPRLGVRHPFHARIADQIPAFQDLPGTLDWSAAPAFWNQCTGSEDADPWRLTPLPDPVAVAENAPAGTWQSSAALSIFPLTPHPDLYREPATVSSVSKGHSFGPLPLDPFQASAAAGTLQQGVAKVAGLPGSGKNYWLSHLIHRALSNGQNVLVVSEQIGLLERLAQQLDRTGLEGMSFLLGNFERDYPLLIEILRSKQDARTIPVDPDKHQQRVRSLRDRHDRLRAAFRASRNSVFDHYSWVETVGRYLEQRQKADKGLLASHLSYADFTLTHEEYEQISYALETLRPLYNRLGTLRHPLQQLHPHWFTEQEKETARATLREALEGQLARFEQLHLRFIQRVHQYADALRMHYEVYYRRFRDAIDRLRRRLQEHQQTYGEDFDLTSRTSLQLYGLVSGRYREILEARREVGQWYGRLRDDFQCNPYFDFAFASASEVQSVPFIRNQVAEFDQQLRSWYQRVGDLVQESVTRLSSTNLHPEVDQQEVIADLEKALDRQLASLNETGIFAQPTKNPMLTVAKRQQLMEDIMDRLEHVRLDMRDFDPFYDWQRAWLPLPGNARQVVRALVKVKPLDWGTAFSSWYLYGVLENRQQEALPERKLELAAYHKAWLQVADNMGKETRGQWRRRSEKAIRDFRRSDRRRYQELFQKRTATLSPEMLFGELWYLVREYIPLVLATPDSLQRMPFYADRQPFDWVVSCEHTHQPRRDKVLGGHLGKRIVRLRETLQLEAATEEAWQLAHNYRQIPGFPTTSTPDGYPYPSAPGQVEWHDAEGWFDDQHAVNEKEAEKVIQLLNQIEATPQRTFPSVGVLALTTAQRDLLLEYFRQIRAAGGDGAERLSMLERNGLGVYTPEETAFLQFDIVICSTTYAQEEALLAHWDRPDTVPQIQQMAYLPHQSLWVVTSLTGALLEQLAARPPGSGAFFLANYLSGVWQTARGETATARQYAKHIGQEIGGAVVPHRYAGFFQQVVKYLLPYLPGARVEWNVWLGGYQVPIVLERGAEQAPLILLADGFWSDQPATDFAWEYRQRQWFTELGYRVVPVWSVDWFRQPELAARRLAGQILDRPVA